MIFTESRENIPEYNLFWRKHTLGIGYGFFFITGQDMFSLVPVHTFSQNVACSMECTNCFKNQFFNLGGGCQAIYWLFFFLNHVMRIEEYVSFIKPEKKSKL